jgi:hypothetical protein
MDWVAYFQQNRARRRNIPWACGIGVEAHLAAPLIRSLQRFQVGERGDGVHLQKGAATTGDLGYVKAIALFIEEEKEHASLLARLLQCMGAGLITNHWSDNLFICIRHLMGLRLELCVLLSAEMIAKRYYRALYEGTRDPVLQAVFGQICADEEGHIAFHVDFLGAAFGGLPTLRRRLLQHGWRLFFWVVCLVVAFDHRHVLWAVHVPPGRFWRECQPIFEATVTSILARQVAQIEDANPMTPALLRKRPMDN